jgi:hypothetical protein
MAGLEAPPFPEHPSSHCRTAPFPLANASD